MSVIAKHLTPPSFSLRKRQQQSVRTEIMQAAMTLFLNVGFEETVIDAIADAANVSRSTVFRYFPTKEDIVVAWSLSSGEELAEAVRRRPAGEAPVDCLCGALLDHVLAHADWEAAALAIGRLMETTPSLRARSAEKYALWERVLTEGFLSRDDGDPRQEPTVRVIAAAVMGVFRVSAQMWIERDGKEPLPEILAAGFATLKSR
ncbi:TetR/AcrR family transcriptional regulator [Streptomyces sp. NPDC048282]|uniref:TetR/AcrR family transcriptional regulator n=1 Tax=Streptomyces sp. NPDC048282 TaxID=3365528 RepID=UPI00371778B1